MMITDRDHNYLSVIKIINCRDHNQHVQVAEEKANARESSYKEQIKTLTAKLKQEIAIMMILSCLCTDI